MTKPTSVFAIKVGGDSIYVNSSRRYAWAQRDTALTHLRIAQRKMPHLEFEIIEVQPKSRSARDRLLHERLPTGLLNTSRTKTHISNASLYGHLVFGETKTDQIVDEPSVDEKPVLRQIGRPAPECVINDANTRLEEALDALPKSKFATRQPPFLERALGRVRNFVERAFR